MNLLEKKEKLNVVKKYLNENVHLNGKVENVGSVFFAYNLHACVLRDTVFYKSKEFGLDFEVLCMLSSYFVGTKAHAEALKEGFGGTVEPTEYCAIANGSRELYVWQGPRRGEQLENSTKNQEVTPLDIEEIKDILF